eukprot:829228_1
MESFHLILWTRMWIIPHIWHHTHPNQSKLSYRNQQLNLYLQEYTDYCDFENTIRRSHPMNLIGWTLQCIINYRNLRFCTPSGYDKMTIHEFADIILAEYANDLNNA